MDSIVNKVLCEFQQIVTPRPPAEREEPKKKGFFARLFQHKEPKLYEKSYEPKSSIIVTQYNGYDGESYTRPIISCWKVTAHEIVKVADDYTAEHEPITGMYFHEASGGFAINATRDRVVFSYQIGPRYGVGLLMKVEENSLKEIEQLWIS